MLVATFAYKIMKFLIKQKVSFNIKEHNRGTTSLMWAVANKDLRMIKLLVDKAHCNVNVQDKQGRSLLYYTLQFTYNNQMTYST